MSPAWGGHTSFPILGITVPDWAPNVPGRTRDFVLLVSESLRTSVRRSASSRSWWTSPTERMPFSVATFQVPDPSGDFCRRGGRFGPHSSNESFTPDLLRPAGLHRLLQRGRARGGHPRPVPSDGGRLLHPGGHAEDRQALREGAAAPPRCKVAIQTNNVDVDDRGYIYIVDRADTGLHIVELTGAARAIANFSR